MSDDSFSSSCDVWNAWGTTCDTQMSAEAGWENPASSFTTDTFGSFSND
jgi:hypothetical protein